jgi:hypothetical protein
VTKADAVHLTLGNPRTVCGRRRQDVNRLTRELKEVTCGHCRRWAPDSAKVLAANADKWESRQLGADPKYAKASTEKIP